MLMMLAFGGLLVSFFAQLMLMTLAFGWLFAPAMPGPGLVLMMLFFGWLLVPAGLSQLMRLLVPADAYDAGLWVASCPSHARAWAADTHDARLWLASCPN